MAIKRVPGSAKMVNTNKIVTMNQYETKDSAKPFGLAITMDIPKDHPEHTQFVKYATQAEVDNAVQALS